MSNIMKSEDQEKIEKMSDELWDMLKDQVPKEPEPKADVSPETECPWICFKCGINIPSNDDFSYDCIVCYTSGNFGSTVYDPAPEWNGKDERMYFRICDKCVVENRDRFLIVGEGPSKKLPTHSPFHPEHVQSMIEHQSKAMAEDPDCYYCNCQEGKDICDFDCACKNPVSSKPCDKCCKQGNYEQRYNKAKHLMEKFYNE